MRKLWVVSLDTTLAPLSSVSDHLVVKHLEVTMETEHQLVMVNVGSKWPGAIMKVVVDKEVITTHTHVWGIAETRETAKQLVVNYLQQRIKDQAELIKMVKRI